LPLPSAQLSGASAPVAAWERAWQMFCVVNKALKPQAEIFVKFSPNAEESSDFDT
jgi:hypothetical protein